MGGDIWAKCNNNQMSTTIHKQWEHGSHSGPLSGFLRLGLSCEHLESERNTRVRARDRRWLPKSEDQCFGLLLLSGTECL